MHIQIIIDYDDEARTICVEHGEQSEGVIGPHAAAELMRMAIEALQDPANIAHDTMQ